MTLQAVVFDMDGVVVDSARAWWKTFNQALESFSLPTVTEQKFMTTILGESTDDDLEIYFPGVSEEELLAAYDRFYSENIETVNIFPDTKPLLDYLDSEGLDTAIATNTPRDLAEMTLDQSELLFSFSIIATSDDVENGKPAPDIIHYVCHKLEIGVDEIIYVGDTLSDVKAAAAAGCRMVGVGIESKETITRLRELEPIVKKALGGG